MLEKSQQNLLLCSRRLLMFLAMTETMLSVEWINPVQLGEVVSLASAAWRKSCQLRRGPASIDEVGPGWQGKSQATTGKTASFPIHISVPDSLT